MGVAVPGRYAGGDPRLDEALEGTLRITTERVWFAYDQVWLDGMTPKHRVGEVDWPGADVLGLSIGDVAHYRGLTVGGLMPVGDDLLVGALGQVGGSSSALIMILIRTGDGGGRRLVRFATTAPDAESFLNMVQRERLAAGLPPLAPVDRVDAQARADDEATVLIELRDLAREQVELLRQIASRLQ